MKGSERMAKLSDEKRALHQVLKAIPRAFWEACIEAGKVSPSATLGLVFFKGLQDALHKGSAEDRAKLAEAVKKAQFDDILFAIEKQGIEIESQRIVLARVFSGIAQYGELINGVAPTLPELLSTIARLDTLPDEVLSVVRTELALMQTGVEAGSQKIDGVPAKVVEAIRGENRLKSSVEHEAFEKEYLKAIKQEYGYMQILGIPSYSQWHLIDAGFISLSLGGASFRRLPAESVLRDHPQLVIVGLAGTGKTTLMQWEAVRCCDEREEDIARPGGMIPFFIRLRRLVRKDGDYSAFPNPKTWVELSVENLTTPVPADWLSGILREGRALLILDGLDELPPEKRPAFWDELERCLRQYKNLHFRVTSRPFPHEEDEAGQWRVPENPNTGDSTPQVSVLELTPDRIYALIDQWHKAATESEPTPEFQERTRRDLAGYADELKEKLDSPRFFRMFDLAKTPFFCAAICLINRHRQGLLPEDRHELYRMLVEALLGLRDKGRHIVSPREYESLKEDVLVRLHARLALDMMTNGMMRGEDGTYLVEVSRNDAVTWLRDYIPTAPALRDARMDAGSLLNFIVTRCGLLREPAKGRLDFRHRALQEYLAGSAAMMFNKCGQLVGVAQDDRWRDTIVLAAGGYQVGGTDAVRLIDDLIERGNKEDLRICYAIAVACLETIGAKIDTKTQDRALEKLGQLVPPRNMQDAKVLQIAGDHVVAYLPYDKMSTEGIETLAACAETLRRVGSETARQQLRKGYWSDERHAVLEQVVQCPGIHPLELPALVEGAKNSRKLAVPRYARPYLRNIEPLKELSGLERLDLSDCGELVDLTGLSTLTTLRELNLNRCKSLADISPVEALVNLESLSLRCCDRITNLAALQKLTCLKSLDVANCRGIEDFTFLKALGNLGALDIQGCDKAEDPALNKQPSRIRAGLSFFETAGGLNLAMMWIPGGTFKMGRDGYDREMPTYEVRLGGFWIARYPVTQAQYEVIMGTNPSHFRGAHRPVDCVSWEDAARFCEILSKRSGRKYALPSEAQWEYACHADSAGQYCFSNSEEEVREYAWYRENSEVQTHPVGMLKPNVWGVYDMHGHVWEWCKNYWRNGYEGSPDEGRARESTDNGAAHVLCGGSWESDPRLCRSASRLSSIIPHIGLRYFGFRVLLTLAARE